MVWFILFLDDKDRIILGKVILFFNEEIGGLKVWMFINIILGKNVYLLCFFNKFL